MVAVETILALFLGFLLFLWVSVKVRKGGRWFKEKGLFGISLFVIIVGAICLSIAFLSTRIPLFSFAAPYVASLIKVGTFALVAGSAGIILDQIYRTWKRERMLSLEDERRKYIERVRFGLPVGQAEKKAKEHIQRVTGKKTKLVASKKEFKHWAIYLKDKEGKYYRVVINGDGKIEEWETMDEIPSYILSP